MTVESSPLPPTIAKGCLSTQVSSERNTIIRNSLPSSRCSVVTFDTPSLISRVVIFSHLHVPTILLSLSFEQPMNVLHSTVSIKIAFFICWVKDLNSYTINNAKLPFLFPFAKTKTATDLRQRIANHIPLLVVVVRFGLDSLYIIGCRSIASSLRVNCTRRSRPWPIPRGLSLSWCAGRE